jgi:hypothetical protein
MDTEEIKQNPYAPPETLHPVTKQIRNVANNSRPIVPAVIGLFTYGSSSPYALVLYVEQYLRSDRSSIPLSTHVAAGLSILGTMVWISLNLVYSSGVVDLLTGRGTSMYAGLGLSVWSASVAFLIWLIWRIMLFQKSSSFRLRE